MNIKRAPVPTNLTPLDNMHVQVTYDRVNKSITAYDKDDRNNEPACYTKVRSLPKLDALWATLQEAMRMMPDTMTHKDVMAAMTQHGVRYHYWCRMD
jgi:hypothetical protein